MANVCGTRYYILSTLSPGTYNVWDKQDKVIRAISFGSVTDYYELNSGSIIDVIEQSGFVYLVIAGSPVENVNFVPLSSTSGDYYNVILSAYVSAGNLVVIMWATTMREITTLNFPMQVFDSDSPANPITPCFNDYNLPDNTILQAWCDGFTLNEAVYTSSPFGVTIVQTPNSTLCGWNPPIEPFRFSEQKTIEYKGCVLNNPIYIVWKNLVGGWDQWLFEKTQTETIQVNSLGSYTESYDKISDTNNPESEIGRTAKPRIVLGAENLTTSQVLGLKGLLLSNRVFIVNQDGTVNRRVKLIDGSFTIRKTDEFVHDIEFEIDDVAINTIKN
jgi:hypothetical protein